MGGWAVPDAGAAGSGAGSDRRRPGAAPVAWRVGLAVELGRSTVAQRPGQLLGELLVLVAQPADLAVGGLQTLPQRSVGGALAGRDRRRIRCPLMLLVPGAQPTDLKPKVRLGVQPGAGDAGGAGDGVEGDRSTAGSQAASAWMARSRVAWLRRRAAWTRKRLLSARIGHVLALVRVGIGVVGFQGGDDPVQVAENLAVHLHDA